MKKKLNYLNKFLILLILAVSFYKVFDNIEEYRLSYYLILLSNIPILLFPTISKKIFHYKMSEEIKFLYFLFIFIALMCGSVLELYHRIPWFDLFAHFLSGIASSIFAIIILFRRTKLVQENVFITILFALCFSLAIASCWEFFEFFCDQILKEDAQYVQATGVGDTMTDMLIAFLGSILFSLYYGLEMKFRKKKFTRMIENVL